MVCPGENIARCCRVLVNSAKSFLKEERTKEGVLCDLLVLKMALLGVRRKINHGCKIWVIYSTEGYRSLLQNLRLRLKIFSQLQLSLCLRLRTYSEILTHLNGRSNSC